MRSFAITIAALFIVSFFFPFSCFATEKTKADEVYELALEAAQFLKKKGKRGLSEFNKAKGEFARRRLSVAISNCDSGKIAAHPDRRMRGRSTNLVKCMKNGRLIMTAGCGKKKSSGTWMAYWWTKPNSKNIQRKIILFMPVTGTNYQVSVSLYNEDLSLAVLNAMH
jgi:hypothetical protein